MRVFVAGATGAIGRRLVPALIGAGHEVTGMTRSLEKAEALRAQGAEPAVADALDAEAVRRAIGEARPEAVINELTELPSTFNPRKVDYEPTNRLRREGTRHLADAAIASGARRLISQSIAFLYAPEGDAVKSEDARPFTDAPKPFGGGVAATLEMEQTTLGTAGLDGVVLRYGWFYGPGTYFAHDGSTAEQVRRRRFPIVGDGGGVSSYIHVDDAATATVAALERGSGIYNVVDDDPAPMREWLPAYAEALGAKPPRRVPAWLARLVAGRFAVAMTTELRGASNQRAKRKLGWAPGFSSWRQGFRAGLG